VQHKAPQARLRKTHRKCWFENSTNGKVLDQLPCEKLVTVFLEFGECFTSPFLSCVPPDYLAYKGAFFFDYGAIEKRKHFKGTDPENSFGFPEVAMKARQQFLRKVLGYFHFKAF